MPRPTGYAEGGVSSFQNGGTKSPRKADTSGHRDGSRIAHGLRGTHRCGGAPRDRVPPLRRGPGTQPASASRGVSPFHSPVRITLKHSCHRRMRVLDKPRPRRRSSGGVSSSYGSGTTLLLGPLPRDDAPLSSDARRGFVVLFEVPASREPRPIIRVCGRTRGYSQLQ